MTAIVLALLNHSPHCTATICVIVAVVCVFLTRSAMIVAVVGVAASYRLINKLLLACAVVAVVLVVVAVC